MPKPRRDGVERSAAVSERVNGKVQNRIGWLFGIRQLWGRAISRRYRKFFHDCDVSVVQDSLDHPHYSPAAYERIKSMDAIIIGGGDLFIPKYFAQNYFDDQFLQKPIYMHGVGVPLWIGEDPAVIERMARFVQHPNVRRINVRDKESARWVKEKLKPNAPLEYSVDMVFSLDFPKPPKDPKKKVFGLVMRKLTPGQTRWDRIAALWTAPAAMATRYAISFSARGGLGR